MKYGAKPDKSKLSFKKNNKYRMKNHNNILLLLFSISFTAGISQAQEKPPFAAVSMVNETYFGKEVSDPYRYMENVTDTTFLSWVRAQAKYSRKVLNSIPGRKNLLDKLWEFDGRRNSNIYYIIITENDKYFYLKTTPEDETAKLFYRAGLAGKELLLFDPENYKKDTLKYMINSLQPSIDGSKIAFEVAANGSESSDLLILDVATKKLFPETIDKCWDANVMWLPDGERFLYFRLNSKDVYDEERLLNTKTFLHTVGQSTDTDKEIFSRQKYPELGIKEEELPVVYYDKDNHLLYGMPVTVDRRLKVYMASADDLDNPKIHWKPLITEDDHITYIDTDYGEMYLLTPKGAPNFKIIKISLGDSDLQKSEIVVPENKKGIIKDFVLTKDGLYYTISQNGVQQKLYYLPKGEKTAHNLLLPTAAGSISLTSKSSDSSDLWVTLNGWTSSYVRYRYDPKLNKFIEETLSSKTEYPEYKDLLVEEVMVPSPDGVEIPLSLIYNKHLKKDGNNPVLIMGYGAYGYSMSPFFSPEYLLSTTQGAIFAIAHVRGGSELGENWYKGGYKTTKPNTWKDLITCTQYLIDKKYTAQKKVAIYSASAGGILIGRAMTERPDLFAVAIPEVGALNSIRSEFSPNGPVNVPEFGTVKDSIEFFALYEMDAYQHLVDGEKYPATLVTAGMNDPRVTVWEPAKFAARLQAANSSDKPVLFSVDFEAGHGVGDSKTTYFESMADITSFFLWQTGHPEFQLR